MTVETLPTPLADGLKKLAAQQHRDPDELIREAIARLLLQQLPPGSFPFGATEYVKNWSRTA